MSSTPPKPAVIFDLDGVLTDTAELHYQSWQALADELGLPFDRQRNEALRGLSREQSLALVLADRAGEFSAERQRDLLERKNRAYLEQVDRMTAADLLPGAAELLAGVRAAGWRCAVGSSSRNARRVIERLGIGGLLDLVVDGNDAPRSKPDPQVFLLAAERLDATPTACVVVEDAAAGVEAARRAGMAVLGVGPAQRVGAADAHVARIADVDVELLASLLAARGLRV